MPPRSFYGTVGGIFYSAKNGLRAVIFDKFQTAFLSLGRHDSAEAPPIGRRPAVAALLTDCRRMPSSTHFTVRVVHVCPPRHSPPTRHSSPMCRAHSGNNPSWRTRRTRSRRRSRPFCACKRTIQLSRRLPPQQQPTLQWFANSYNLPLFR